MPPSTIRNTLIRPNSLVRASKCSNANAQQQRRNESTYRRHIKRLSIPPAPSFGPQKSNRKPNDAPSSSHIVFNPPPSAPNVYHTPLKFLPPTDRRRSLYESAAKSLYNVAPNNRKDVHTASPVSKPGTALHEISRSMPTSLLPRVPPSDPMPPPLKEVKEKKYHLTPEDVKEMQRLRKEDPKQWTIDRLAEKFGTGTFFVRMAARNKGAGIAHEMKLKKQQDRWGKKRRQAKEDRVRRKALWGRDA